MNHLANKLWVVEKYGMTVLEFAVAKVFDPASDDSTQKYYTAVALPFCHPKLKQVELTDMTPRRRPEEIERDITAYVERVSRDRGGRRDLIGPIE